MGLRRSLWFQAGLRFLELGAAGLVGLILLERCNQGGSRAAISWLIVAPRALVGLSFLLLICFYGLLRVWFRRPLIPFAIYCGLIFLISVANYFKIFYRSEPLIPYDVFNVGPAMGIAGNLGMRFSAGLWLNLFFCLLSLLGMWQLQRRAFLPSPLKRRYAAPVGVFFCLLVFYFMCDKGRLAAAGVRDIRYDQLWNYHENGFAAATLLNLTDSGLREPPGYDAGVVAELRRRIEAAPDLPALGSPSRPPHIIILQMEAYGDPGFVDPGVGYREDPFLPLAPYEGELRRFRALTSNIGGGTANTEFELLTGFNLCFAPSGVIPMVSYGHRSFSTLAGYLASQGYRTVAMHPNDASFYNRAVAYPNLGFQEFIDLADFDEPVYRGYYVSDQSFGEKVRELFAAAGGRGPLLLFGISIQNHGPYGYPEIYRPYPLALEDGLTLSETQVRELETYGANIQDGSRMLAELIEYFAGADEPVLLLAYGDHQASWSWAAGRRETADSLLGKYTTVGFFWANYPLAPAEREIISAAGLAPQILRRAGLPLSIYFKGIDLQFQEIPAYNGAVMINDDGSARYADRSLVAEDLMLQYDRVFGRDYLDNGEAYLDSGELGSGESDSEELGSGESGSGENEVVE
ncbi:MAG: LTA synthase family protein [Peptococcaceae bacterium]|jgi:phosphoglycerol transferase MdoB-like AlkP superfamily enzyme|nr:LTA synthase family protein [Peptococcaceae bacterium]